MSASHVLGIDIGGSGIKGAPVNVETGELTRERFRIATPLPATPEAVAEAVDQLVNHFEYSGPVGCGFPAAVQRGVARTASNIHKSWIGTHVENLFSEKTGLPFTVINDADAAGLAEVRFGAGRDVPGVLVVITVGTGIGTALFSEGTLVPNTEFGHIALPGIADIAEDYAANSIREQEELDWDEWGKRFDIYLNRLYKLFYPSLIIVGGGQSKRFEKYAEQLSVPARVTPARLLNNAGIVGAAMATLKRV